MEQLQNTWNIMHENCMVLNGLCVASVGLNNNTEYYKLKSTGSDLDRSRLIDTRSAENDWIGADTDPQYRIDASLLIIDNDEMAYRDEVSTLTKWCQENHLSLNIDKTKELVVDFRRQSRYLIWFDLKY